MYEGHTIIVDEDKLKNIKEIYSIANRFVGLTNTGNVITWAFPFHISFHGKINEGTLEQIKYNSKPITNVIKIYSISQFIFPAITIDDDIFIFGG